MKWVVHIGVRKTGSKAIQDFLAHEPHRIKGYNVCFPKSGRAGIWHFPIYEELMSDRCDTLQTATNEVTESLADIGIISYEALYCLAESQIKKMREVLGPARIILFIRRQDQLINSMYNQLFKAHRVDYSEIISFESSMFDYNPDYDHFKTLEKWSAIFGKVNMVPIIYDKRKNSIQQFFNGIGVSADFENYDFYNPNPALDAQSLGIFRAVKQQNVDPTNLPNLINAAHSILRRYFLDTYSEGDQYLLNMTQRKTIACHYKDSNEQLRRVYFPERKSLFPSLEYSDVCRTNLPVDQGIVKAIFKKAGLQQGYNPEVE